MKTEGNETGINRSIMIRTLSCVLLRAPMDSLMRGALTFSASLVHFDAIPTAVSNHYSVGLILLQGSVYPKQRRCIPNSVGVSQNRQNLMSTVSVRRRCPLI
jgi:hypothetical protein